MNRVTRAWPWTAAGRTVACATHSRSLSTAKNQEKEKSRCRPRCPPAPARPAWPGACKETGCLTARVRAGRAAGARSQKLGPCVQIERRATHGRFRRLGSQDDEWEADIWILVSTAPAVRLQNLPSPAGQAGCTARHPPTRFLKSHPYYPLPRNEKKCRPAARRAAGPRTAGVVQVRASFLPHTRGHAHAHTQPRSSVGASSSALVRAHDGGSGPQSPAAQRRDKGAAVAQLVTLMRGPRAAAVARAASGERRGPPHTHPASSHSSTSKHK
jgi:hypothetical protein